MRKLKVLMVALMLSVSFLFTSCDWFNNGMNLQDELSTKVAIEVGDENNYKIITEENKPKEIQTLVAGLDSASQTVNSTDKYMNYKLSYSTTGAMDMTIIYTKINDSLKLASKLNMITQDGKEDLIYQYIDGNFGAMNSSTKIKCNENEYNKVKFEIPQNELESFSDPFAIIEKTDFNSLKNNIEKSKNEFNIKKLEENGFVKYLLEAKDDNQQVKVQNATQQGGDQNGTQQVEKFVGKQIFVFKDNEFVGFWSEISFWGVTSSISFELIEGEIKFPNFDDYQLVDYESLNNQNNSSQI